MTLPHPHPVWRNPGRTAKISDSVSHRGDVAQLGERLVCNQEVAGSTPVVSTQALKGLTVKL